MHIKFDSFHIARVHWNEHSAGKEVILYISQLLETRYTRVHVGNFKSCFIFVSLSSILGISHGFDRTLCILFIQVNLYIEWSM